MKAINTIAINALFDRVDNKSTSFTERLFTLGVCTRAIAYPLAMQWAVTKYEGVKARPGQRGMTLPRGSAADKAMRRVLDVCFPPAERPQSTSKSVSKTDVVTSLLKKYAALTGAEKRRFMMSLGK